MTMPSKGAGGRFDEFGEFEPADFAFVIAQLPERCPLVGGQAVAWWAQRYDITLDNGLPVTSSDIDFWGDRNDLMLLASRLKLKPIFPHQYEMTVWVGAVQIRIQDKKSLAEFLHTVPGLDLVDPDKASVEQEYRTPTVTRVIQVLTPVSLIYVKLHCLRSFGQEGRDDERHLRVCIRAARRFLHELLEQRLLRLLFWNLERIAFAHRFKPYQALQRDFAFNLLEAVPIDAIKQAIAQKILPDRERKQLERFLRSRWTQISSACDSLEHGLP